MTLQEAREKGERLYATARAINRIIQGEDFEKAMSRKDCPLLDKLFTAFPILGTPNEFRLWIKSTIEVDLGEKPIMELRRMARDYHIAYYAHLTRAQLLSAIKNAEALRESDRVKVAAKRMPDSPPEPPGDDSFESGLLLPPPASGGGN